MNTFFFDDVQYPEGLFGGKDFFNPIIYSTEEREVGAWTDNKPLYQKTFIITSKQSQIDISSLNIDTYVKSESVYRVGSYCFEMPRLADITQNYNTYISTYYAELNNGNINFLWGTGVSSIDELHFTIQYTKTTDTAGSGNYTTLGVPSVHYTTDEQVIGTWIDGKPLYQKTIAIHNESTVSSNTTITTIDSTFRVKNWKAFAIEYGVNYQIPYVAGNGNASFYFRENGNVDFTITNTSFAAGSDFYITIEYTKTTD